MKHDQPYTVEPLRNNVLIIILLSGLKVAITIMFTQFRFQNNERLSSNTFIRKGIHSEIV